MSRRRSHQGQAAAHGVLIVDKPTGPTSHDVVSQVRRYFGTRRVGHAGTLDPLATGVLVLLLGEATKLSAYLTRQSKSYEAEIEFGTATDSLDSQGKITRRRELSEDWAAANRTEIEHALEAESRRTLQVPPQVSAIKISGQSAHARVRRGETVEIAPRTVAVHEAHVTRVEGRRASISIRVSKGYYVRSLARDLGEALGQPAHLTALRRTSSGAFTLDDAIDLPLFAANGSRTPTRATGPLPSLMGLVEAAQRSLPTGELNALGAQRAGFGQVLLEDCWVRPPELSSPPPPSWTPRLRGRLRGMQRPPDRVPPTHWTGAKPSPACSRGNSWPWRIRELSESFGAFPQLPPRASEARLRALGEAR